MKFSKAWLKELTKLDIETEALAEQLTMVGLEINSVEPVAGKFHGVVVGEILEVRPHPNADKLTVCLVSVNSTRDNLNIVCGAANVRPNLKVPVALIGAELKDGFKIKKARLRGIDSYGMMCSALELGLPAANPGLLELPEDAPIGVDIRRYLALDDEEFTIELTANRGDCLSILGVAREVAAINRTKLLPITIPKFLPNSDVFPVVVKAKEVCPHYCGRIIRGVNNRASTPLWMQQRLGDLAMHPANFVVDVTNYVMLELGQPLHAFDLAKLDKKIEVRYAKPGEKIELLYGQQLELNEKTLLIADNIRPLALAGVMGGLDSGISLDTKDIFLESAFFAPEKIAEQARAYKLQTDASYRYERGIDYELQLYALDRATALIMETAGGIPGAVSEVMTKEHLPKSCEILLHRHSIENILGIMISDKEIADILSYLGITIKLANVGWHATIPSWRAFDIKIEEDLIEEIARVYGYHKIPERKIIAELGATAANSKDDVNRISILMEDLGYHEIISYSFIDKKMQTLFGGEDKVLYLANPLSSEQSIMRTSLWPGLINAVGYNSRRQEQEVRLFEIGLRFIVKENGLEQRSAIAGVVYGDLYPEQWGIKQKESADYFDLKNDVDALLHLFADVSEVEYIPGFHSALHPKRSAQVYVRGEPIGFIGEMHPLVKQQLNFSKRTSLFEIDLSKLIKKIHIKFKEFSVFPKITRDIAIIVNKDIMWSQIRQKIVDISSELLQNVSVFDVYCNENIGLDKRSMAIHLTFQSVERTLIDAEVEVLVDRIILVLKQTFGASLRG